MSDFEIWISYSYQHYMNTHIAWLQIGGLQIHDETHFENFYIIIIFSLDLIHKSLNFGSLAF